jgi:hypothetical protein
VKIEVLYVADCPSHPAAVKLIREALAAHDTDAEIREVLVLDKRMADELRFCGSPTIRIDGRDVACDATQAQESALSCRLYPGSEHVGLPSAATIHRALLEARKG